MSKTKHAPDYAKNKDADVIPKGNKSVMPKDHYEIHIGKSVFQEDHGKDPMDAFLPKPGKDRMTMHIKINECDH